VLSVCVCRNFPLAHFQVREARVYDFLRFFACFLSLSDIIEVCSWFDCLILVKMCFPCGFCVVHERIVASTGFLAQVSLPHLGEISRGLARTY